MQRSELKAWSWDACKKRLQELKGSGSAEDAVKLWKNVTDTISAANTRERQAVALESFERMCDTWQELDMQSWFTNLLDRKFDPAVQIPRQAMDAMDDSNTAINLRESAF